MGKSRILVLQLKQLALISAAIILVIIFIIAGINALKPKNNTKQTLGEISDGEASYTPGVYSTQFSLGNELLNMEVTLDENHINNVQITNLNGTITSTYPLLESTLSSISTQLRSGTPIDDVIISNDSTYTGKLLLNTIKSVTSQASN